MVNVLNVNDNIFLSVVIGNGQIGGNKGLLDGKLIAKGNLSEQAFIGTCSGAGREGNCDRNQCADVNAFTMSA
ncbi:MAG: hypothetical protein IPM96_22030 [Ignavibacteria bacterium]|nr:hypothetical protein [Ignavibacteria bacterium]